MTSEISSLKLIAKTKKSRDMIISNLSNNKPLTAKELHNSIQREFGTNITYQAIFKTLKELESEEVIEKEKNKYSIKLSWIDYNRKLLDNIEERLLRKNNSESKETIVIESNTFHGFGRNLLQTFASDFDKGLFKDVCSFQNHLWWTLALQKDEYYWFKKIGKSKAHIICKSDSLFDRCMAAVYRLAGHKVKLGVDYDSNCDLVVYNNKIYQIYFPEKLKSDIENSTKGLKTSLGILKGDYQRIMYLETGKIKTTILEDREIASRLRNEIKSIFEE